MVNKPDRMPFIILTLPSGLSRKEKPPEKHCFP